MSRYILHTNCHEANLVFCRLYENTASNFRQQSLWWAMGSASNSDYLKRQSIFAPCQETDVIVFNSTLTPEYFALFKDVAFLSSKHNIL